MSLARVLIAWALVVGAWAELDALFEEAPAGSKLYDRLKELMADG